MKEILDQMESNRQASPDIDCRLPNYLQYLIDLPIFIRSQERLWFLFRRGIPEMINESER